MKPFSYLRLVLTGCALLAAGPLLSGLAHAHGGLSMAEDMCKLTVGPYMMHFTGYQPGNTQQKAFCEDIPGTGETVVVLDYIEQELRSLPTEVRIIRDTGSEENLEAITILHLPSKVYANGSIDFTHIFPEKGNFVGIVTVTGDQPYVSRFPFSVGETKIFSKLLNVYMVPVLATIIVVGIYYYTRNREKREKQEKGTPA